VDKSLDVSLAWFSALVLIAGSEPDFFIISHGATPWQPIQWFYTKKTENHLLPLPSTITVCYNIPNVLRHHRVVGRVGLEPRMTSAMEPIIPQPIKKASRAKVLYLPAGILKF